MEDDVELLVEAVSTPVVKNESSARERRVFPALML